MSDDTAPTWALEMTQTLGEIKGGLTALNTNFTSHLADDAKLTERVGVVERRLSWQAGAVKVWGLVATGVSSIAGGLLVHYIGKGK